MLRVGVVSSWNVRCGIAEYCAYLLRSLREQGVTFEVFADRTAVAVKPDERFVHRDWDNTAHTLPGLERSILQQNINCVLIQYHNAFYPPPVLGSLLDRLSARGIAVFVIFHTTHDASLGGVSGSLTRAALNLVHSIPDVGRLSSYGLKNVKVLPHGIRMPERQAGADGLVSDEFSIGSFGFLMPHKGFLQLICAAYLLKPHIPDLQLSIYASLYPSIGSQKLLTRCQEYIRYLGCSGYVEFEPQFLDIDDVMNRLRRRRLLVYPYQESNESSSAAVRTGLATGRPVLCTPLPIFGDAAEVLHYCNAFDAFAIAGAVLERYRDPQLLNCKSEQQRAYLEKHSWTNVAKLLAAEMTASKHAFVARA